VLSALLAFQVVQHPQESVEQNQISIHDFSVGFIKKRSELITSMYAARERESRASNLLIEASDSDIFMVHAVPRR
jgi:hypothetical protein